MTRKWKRIISKSANLQNWSATTRSTRRDSPRGLEPRDPEQMWLEIRIQWAQEVQCGERWCNTSLCISAAHTGTGGAVATGGRGGGRHGGELINLLASANGYGRLPGYGAWENGRCARRKTRSTRCARRPRETTGGRSSPGEPVGGRVHLHPSFHRVVTHGPGEQRVGMWILGAPEISPRPPPPPSTSAKPG